MESIEESALQRGSLFADGALGPNVVCSEKIFGRITGDGPERLLEFTGEIHSLEGIQFAFLIVVCMDSKQKAEPTRGELVRVCNRAGFSRAAHGSTLPDGTTVMLYDPLRRA